MSLSYVVHTASRTASGKLRSSVVRLYGVFLSADLGASSDHTPEIRCRLKWTRFPCEVHCNTGQAVLSGTETGLIVLSWV